MALEGTTRESVFRNQAKSHGKKGTPVIYDVSKPVTLSVDDSSSYGLSACLLQAGRPVSYAFTFLDQRRKELCPDRKGTVSKTILLHQISPIHLSKSATVETDHTPLEYLFRKPLTAAPPRLQRMMFNLQKYDLTVEYKPGKDWYIADSLSRAPSPTIGDTEDQYVVHTVEYLPVSNEKLQHFRLETRNDPTLKKLFHTIQTGWPNKNPDADPSINEYFGQFVTKLAVRMDYCYMEKDSSSRRRCVERCCKEYTKTIWALKNANVEFEIYFIGLE